MKKLSFASIVFSLLTCVFQPMALAWNEIEAYFEDTLANEGLQAYTQGDSSAVSSSGILTLTTDNAAGNYYRVGVLTTSEDYYWHDLDEDETMTYQFYTTGLPSPSGYRTVTFFVLGNSDAESSTQPVHDAANVLGIEFKGDGTYYDANLYLKTSSWSNLSDGVLVASLDNLTTSGDDQTVGFTLNNANEITLIVGDTAATTVDLDEITGFNIDNFTYEGYVGLQAIGTPYGGTTDFNFGEFSVTKLPPESDSDGSLTASAAVAEPVALPTTADSAGKAVDLFDFAISDGGGGDGLPLGVSQIVVHVSGTSTDTERGQIVWRLDGPDASGVAGVCEANTDTITFGSLSISVDDGGSETYTVNGYYSDNTGLTEGLTFILEVDGDTDLVVETSGTQMGATSPVTNGTGTTVEIEATKLGFAIQPAGSVSGQPLTTQPWVAAQDEAGNTDLDFTGEVTLTEASAGSLSNNTKTAIVGVAVFANLTYTATADQEAFVLTADEPGTLATATSDPVVSDVVATKLRFSTQPAPTQIQSGIEVDFDTDPVVQATDANDIVDTEYATDIVLSVTDPDDGTLDGAVNSLAVPSGDQDADATTVTLSAAIRIPPVGATFENGVATFTGLSLQYTNSGPSNTIALRASSGALSPANSASIVSTANTVPSTGAVAADDVVQADAGATSYTLTVEYIDSDDGIDVSTIGIDDVSVDNGATVSWVSLDNETNGSPRTATYTVTPPGGSWDDADNGDYTVSLAANQVCDANASPECVPANAALATFSVDVDTTAPIATITRDDGNPTSANTVRFSVDFSEAVVNVDPSDFTLAASGATAATPVTINDAGDSDDAKTYQVVVEDVAGTGTLGLDLAGDIDIEDAAGNASDTTTAIDEIYTIDNRLVINEVDYDQGATDDFEYIEIKNVSGGPVDLGTVGYTVQLIDSEGIAYQTFALAGTLADNDYYVICDTNSGAFDCDQAVNLGDDFISDETPGAVAIVRSGAIIDTLGYGGNVPNGYTETSGAPADDDFTDWYGLARFPDGQDTDDNSADFSLWCATPGACNSNIASPMACNNAPATGTVVADNVGQAAAGGATYTFTVEYVDTDNGIDVSTIDTSDVSIDGGMTVTGASEASGTNGSPKTATYTATPPGGAWDDGDNGNYTISLTGGQVCDAYVFEPACVPASAALATFSVDMDTTAPAASITRDDDNPTVAETVRFSVDFSEPVVNVDPSDFILAASGVSGATPRDSERRRGRRRRHLPGCRRRRRRKRHTGTRPGRKHRHRGCRRKPLEYHDSHRRGLHRPSRHGSRRHRRRLRDGPFRGPCHRRRKIRL